MTADEQHQQRRRTPPSGSPSSTPPCATASRRPGIHLNTREKVEIGHQLARLGVDVIEAGFPISSPGDFEAVRAVADGGLRA